MHTRHCVACAEEFRPEIVYCSDCGALLEDRWEGMGTQVPAPELEAGAEPVPEEHYAAVVTAAGSLEATRAAADLRKAGIQFRVKTHGSPGFDVLVSQEDLDAAMAALAGHSAAVAHTSDLALVEGRCAACQSHVPEGAIECPDCGLFVGNDHSVCESCNSVLDADDERCRECGTARGSG